MTIARSTWHSLVSFLGERKQVWARLGRRQQGFSLLEALVAMSIASIALASLYRTVGQSSKGVGDVESRIEAALVARSALAGSTFAEDVERQPAGSVGDWYWLIRIQPEQIPVREEDGRPAPGAPLRAAMVTVEVIRGQNGPTVMTWTTWKPYRAAP
ncbi:prepilin-type N-terminal cleavage/methylation domain-containing protein [Acidovorax sp. D2M1]|uniref:Prepilin-type N-terminal cleavage/methylation domain-containing protein n=1 Tax=Acidovorax benzenivorans TaxID=2987520 RepID=A0ABT5RSW1_9BURK|nr:prepilin-type N-terminal cleavage/methylation domain-containing protein [Acidovorax benzenivorans]MDD2176771.1 prepilin-type N-terminal cleavage/methylation domain-containing protein [Acidovorax benzenivorans]